MTAPSVWSCVDICDWPGCPALPKVRLVFTTGFLLACQHHANEHAPSLLAVEAFRHASVISSQVEEDHVALQPQPA